MPTNQFQTFGLGAGANVLTPSQWAARTAKSTGFVNGTADPQEINTALRQTAAMSTMLAQFTADESGANVFDNGDLVTLQANFKNAVKASAVQAVTIPTFSTARTGSAGVGPVLTLNNGSINLATDTTILSVSITGAKWIDAYASALFYNVTGTPCGAVIYFNLVNYAGSPTYGQGQTVITTSAATAIPVPIRTVWADLNPATTYTLQLKGLRTVSGVSLTADYPALVANFGG